jgi:hypothetical protein
MASLDMEYNVDELPVGQGYDLIPAGWYEANITKAEIKKTTAGTGQYIAIRYDITGPSQEGRVVFGNINIKNPSSIAENIGRQQLGEIMRAIGLAKVVDSDELLGGSLIIKVGIGKPQYELNAKKELILDSNGDKIIKYEAQNEVTGFKSLDGAEMPEAKKEAKSSTSENSGAEKKKAPWLK